jgi:hypothetical protein
MDLDQQVIDDSAAQQAKVVLRSASRSIETSAFDTDSQSVDNLVEEYEAYYETKSQSGQPLEPGGTPDASAKWSSACPARSWTSF